MIIEKVVNIVGKHYGIDPMRKIRNINHVECRFFIWYYLLYNSLDNVKITQEQVAKYFNYDRSTICQGMNRLRDLLEVEPEMRKKLSSIINLIDCEIKSRKKNVK